MSMDQQNTHLKVVNASNWQHLDLISPELSAQAHCPLKKNGYRYDDYYSAQKCPDILSGFSFVLKNACLNKK